MENLSAPQHVQQAIVKAIANDVSGAIVHYRQAIEKDFSQPAHVYAALGHQLLKSNKADEAEQIFLITCEKYPNAHNGYAGLAVVAQHRKQWDKALQSFDDCLVNFSQQAEWWWHQYRGEALLALKRYEEARVVFQSLSASQPERPHGWVGLAQLAQWQQDWDLAAERWDHCLAKFPQQAVVQWHVNKGNALLELKRFEEAQAVFQSLSESQPDQPKGFVGLAQVARLSGNLRVALDYSLQLIEWFPELATGYVEAEENLIQLGRFEEANLMYLARPSNDKPVIKSKLPEGFPTDLIIPKLVGINNDYTFIMDKVEDFVASENAYTLPVSIIIPVYNRKDILAKTLAAITHQTYPKNLIEVVVVDDGSHDAVTEVIRKYENKLELIYVRQADLGYRLSAARNLGSRAAKHPYIIMLDCDMLPCSKLVEAYMKIFHVNNRAVLIGHRHFVCTDSITDDDILADINTALNLLHINTSNEMASKSTATDESYDWRLAIYARTNFLKEEKWPFRIFAGGNIAYTKKAIQESGEYDESFQNWGCEDLEIGYRYYQNGYYFIPVIVASAMHQEPRGETNQTDRVKGVEITQKQLQQKCPASHFRKYQAGVIYQIPKVSIYIPAYNVEKFIKEAVESVLAQTFTDLEVCICNDGSTDATLSILEENYSNHPRVRWISQPNKGIGNASNTAVRMCRGMYIGQLDADDILLPNAVKVSVDYLDQHDVGCVYSMCQIIDASGKFVREPAACIEFSRERLLKSMLLTHFRMFRMRDWMRTAGFAEDLTNAVDYDMFLKLSEVCNFAHLDIVTYCYRWHGRNTSIQNRELQIKNHFIVINRALERLGLGDEWEAVPANLTASRLVKLQRRQSKAIER